ncbi:MAG: glycosyltransferase family 4 protein [Candidatus Margulisiibacteriota bacterium]|jgi:glycosyltransferase involved in cell wall biosynthesis
MNNHLKRTILFISHQADLSGAPLSLFYLAKELAFTHQYRIVFVLPEDGPLLNKLKDYHIETAVLRGFKTYELWKLIRKLNPDILHINTSVNWVAALLGNYCHIPVIWHIREDLSAHPWVVRMVQRYADRIIVISRSVRGYFPYEFWDKISVIYNGVDLSLFSEEAEHNIWQKIKDLFLNNRLADKKTLNIGYVGSIEPRKGVKELISAFSLVKQRYPQVKLHLVGRVLPVAHGYYQKIDKFTKKYKLDPSIFWHGSVADIEKFIKNMDIMVVPSLSEPFGRVIIESMAIGRVVIASDCGGIPEIIHDQETGFLVKPGDHLELAEVMIRVMEMKGADIEMITKKARLDVEEHFSLEKHVLDVERVYRDVLEAQNIVRST